jgi:hypothetical protein
MWTDGVGIDECGIGVSAIRRADLGARHGDRSGGVRAPGAGTLAGGRTPGDPAARAASGRAQLA